MIILAFNTHGLKNKDIDNNNTVICNNLDATIESKKTVKNFLLWYKKVYPEISRIVLVNISSESKGNKKYTINIDGCEKYLSLLKKSGFISDKYIDQWHSYFMQQSEKYKSTLQTDGPPEGFEYDFVLPVKPNILNGLFSILLLRFSQSHFFILLL